MTYTHWSNRLNETIPQKESLTAKDLLDEDMTIGCPTEKKFLIRTKPITDIDTIAKCYGVEREDAFDIILFIKQFMNEEESRRVIAEVFDSPKPELKTIEIPSIYRISDEVRARYNDLGYQLVAKRPRP